MSDDESRFRTTDKQRWWELVRTEWSGNVAIVASLSVAALVLLVVLLL